MKNQKKICFVLLLTVLAAEISTREIELGPCFLQFLEPCANNSIQFFLFSSDNPRNEPTLLDNISPSLDLDFNETISKNFKMIIHGYGGHLDFNGSKQIRNGIKFSHYRFINKSNCSLPQCTANLPSCEITARHIFTLVSFMSEIFLNAAAIHAVESESKSRVKAKEVAAIYATFNYQFARLLSSTASRLMISL